MTPGQSHDSELTLQRLVGRLLGMILVKGDTPGAYPGDHLHSRGGQGLAYLGVEARLLSVIFGS